ncbi:MULTISPECIES: RNA-guided endonuclease TnpB family protein [Acidithiobacillus]|jgi:putative transposase|uniref:RNA-guided endonuclease TnpB family protein n=1 Tax=Acidithiobacillus TaxID=119977 RepID=UPI0009E1ECBD|nr:MULTISPECIES: RNA-guided endonuclease TnpB family protein [Acidithiobacillus]
MSKASGPSFVLELPLVVHPHENRVLSVRFEAGRQLYNAVLGEALRRLDLMKQSRAWAAARKMPKGPPKSAEQKDRAAAFSLIAGTVGFTDYGLQAYATKCKNACWIGHHLDAHTTQKIATRAFQAAQRYQFRAGGRPRFKPKWKSLESMEGKSNATGLRWREDHLEWAGLSLKAIFDRKDKHGVQAFALQYPVKYCRLLRRTIRGKTLWFVQLVIAGAPKWKEKNPIGQGKVSIDIGPSTIAVVSETDAFLEKFCANVPDMQKVIRRLQRAMDRSKRASNPDNYHPDGTIKVPEKGERLRWVFTQGYFRLRSRLKELQRRLAAYRRTEHGRLANRVIATGNTVMAEKLSYQAFQRMFGKSVRDRAPGGFMNHLRRKAASAGGEVIEFPTRTTKLSQSCHCGDVVKKPLSQRWHDCSCGAHAQRDLYSAYLGLHVRQEHGAWKLDTESAREGWCAAESLLEKAVSGVVQAANGGPLPASFGIRARDRAALSRRWNDAVGGPGCCTHAAVSGMARARKTSASSTRTPRL